MSNLFGPEDCLKRCRGSCQDELIHPLGISLAPTIWLSGEPAVSIANSFGCGRSGPMNGWWHRLWMHLNPFLWCNSPFWDQGLLHKEILLTHALSCLFLGIGKGFLTNLLITQKLLKKHSVLFLFGTLNDGNAPLDACCCFSIPSLHNLSTSLMRVSCAFLALGKLGHGVVLFIPLLERRPA